MNCTSKNCSSKSDSLVALFATLFARMTAVIFLTTAAATAQTYTPLYTYPLTNNNTTGIVWPSLTSQGQDGSLYSTIVSNGAKNAGSVFKMTTGGQYTLLYNFCSQTGCADGSYPFSGVSLGADGNLWGTTSGGGTKAAGTIFKITPSGTLTKMYDFTNGLDDSAPTYAPLLGLDGNFYGVSEAQYNGQYGSFYKITTTGKLTPHPFNYVDGAAPNLGTQATDGNFYGTAQGGGDPTCKCGVVYKATAAGKITVLHAFKGYPTDGYRPIGVLVQGNDGKLYGTTYQGGAQNYGSVFSITTTGVYTLLYSFDSFTGDGVHPLAGLTLGTDGSFYGSTNQGGTKNVGTLYQITSGGTEKILYNFCAVTCLDGIYPATAMVQHTNGKFYGSTSGNSIPGDSIFYSLDMGLAPFAKIVIWKGKVASTVEILGQGLNGTTGVSFNGTPATFSIVSDTYMTAKVPTGAKTGSVSVVTSGGTLVSSHIFLVTPTIKTISPTSGPVGTVVTITGTGLTQTTKVTFGGKTGTFIVNSDSQITATVPSTATTGKIVVTTPGGTATSSATFTVTP